MLAQRRCRCRCSARGGQRRRPIKGLVGGLLQRRWLLVQARVAGRGGQIQVVMPPR